MKLITMAAGCGRRMGELLRGRPKCLIEVGGRALLDWQVDAMRCVGEIDSHVIVTGWGAEYLAARASQRCTLVHNNEHASTNMVHSLFCAAAHFGEGFIMSYGDIAYAPHVLARVAHSDAPISVIVDRSWRTYWQQRFDDVLADAESLSTDAVGDITSIGQRAAHADDIEAQYIGLVAFRRAGVAALREAHALACSGGEHACRVFADLHRRPARAMFMTDLLQGLVNLGARVAAEPIDGGWIEIDSPSDLALAERLVREGRLAPCERVSATRVYTSE